MEFAISQRETRMESLKDQVRKAAGRMQIKAPFVDPGITAKGALIEWSAMLSHQRKGSQLIAAVIGTNTEAVAVRSRKACSGYAISCMLITRPAYGSLMSLAMTC